MNLQDLTARGRSISTKAVAGYATYQTAAKGTAKAVETICHVESYDEDYMWKHWSHALDFAAENAVSVPTFGSKTQATTRKVDNTFKRLTWTPVPAKGIGRLLQARRVGVDTIEFRSPLKSELERLRMYLDAKVQEDEENDPVFDTEERETWTEIMAWGDKSWDSRGMKRSRSFHSVLLPTTLQADIEADLKTYTESRERLQRLEIPWRRGYLLSGPPGTGKTSLSLAIAASLRFRLASLSLTDIKSDGELRHAISSLPARTVLVIEDIDAYSISHDRDHNTAKDGDLSLSGLLNAIDGFETPDGLVTIATTNHIEKLDGALIRSGRFDRTFTLDYIEARELERLFEWFYEESSGTAPASTGQAKLAPAEATELFKQHLDDPQGGWCAVVDHIHNATHVDINWEEAA